MQLLVRDGSGQISGQFGTQATFLRTQVTRKKTKSQISLTQDPTGVRCQNQKSDSRPEKGTQPISIAH